MCTIGNTFLGSGVNITFKQCDLSKKVTFYDPQIKISTINIRYVPFMREGSQGAWCGINEYGVSFVAADSYLDKDGLLKSVAADIFSQYLKIITDCKNAKTAANMMKVFYQKEFKEPDILLIADATTTYFIEAYNGQVQMIERKSGFFASTNHFRMVYGAAPYVQNHSTYLRLQRAESILQQSADLTGVKKLLSDQYYGDTVWSVCRVAKDVPSQEAPFFTQASAIFTAKAVNGKVQVNCQYLINGNPSNTPWKYTNVFEPGKTDENGYLIPDENEIV